MKSSYRNGNSPDSNVSLARRLSRALALAVALAASSAAHATPCSELREREADTGESMARLVANYPGTHAVIAMCAAGASSEYQKSRNSEGALGTFAVCALAGCALAGFDNCIAITKEWFVLSMRHDQIRKAIRDQC